jgi:hypothetical protein
MSLNLLAEVKSSDFTNQLSINNVFTSEYGIYKITISNAEYDGGTGDVVDMRIRFMLADGTIITDNDYESARMQQKAEGVKDEDKFQNLGYLYGVVLVGDFDSAGGILYVYNANNSDSYTFTSGQGSGGYANSSNRFRSTNQIGILKQANTITGINFTSPSASNNFKADVRVFGMSKS